MAKAKEITGIDCAADALVWAGEVLRVRIDEVVELSASALDFSDIEGVHAMRVATRRLRSALRDFLPLLKKRPLKESRKNLKRIADALGAVRDQDVAILALENLQAAAKIDQTDPQIKEGIEKMLENRRASCEAARTNLTQILDVGGLAKLQKDFTIALDKAVGKNKRTRVVSFNEAGRDAVAASLEELCGLGASLYEPFKIKKLHEMRIAAKRLRYAVELFTACWGEAITPFAEEIARMQSNLGELHDCDVWAESLAARLRKRKNDEENQNEFLAAVWLLLEFTKKRAKHYRAALGLWGEWQANDFTERMRSVDGMMN